MPKKAARLNENLALAAAVLLLGALACAQLAEHRLIEHLAGEIALAFLSFCCTVAAVWCFVRAAEVSEKQLQPEDAKPRQRFGRLPIGCLLVAACFPIIGWLFVIGEICGRSHLRKLMKQREGMTSEYFFLYFQERGMPPHIVRAVYDYFENCIGVENFAVLRDDNIDEIYRIDPDDFEEDVLELLEKCGKKLGPKEAYEKLLPLLTVEDLVTFIVACPPIEGPGK